MTGSAFVEWRPVEGLDGRFEVSSNGEVRRAKHTGTGGKAAGTPVTTSNNHGYRYFSTTIARKTHNRAVHRVVAAAFIGPCPKGHEVAHLNGDRSDNRAENLAYKTRQDNCADKVAHGTLLVGEKVGTAKLTAEQVRAIRASDEGPTALAALYGVHYRHIWRLRNGQRWQHLAEVSA